MDEKDILTIVNIFMELFWTFVVMFMSCYIGEKVTTAFEELSDEIYQCEWDTFPYKVQHLLPNIILVAQQSVYIEANGGFTCTHNTYKKVTIADILS